MLKQKDISIRQIISLGEDLIGLGSDDKPYRWSYYKGIWVEFSKQSDQTFSQLLHEEKGVKL